VTNAPENIVRMKRGKIVTHYKMPMGALGPLGLGRSSGSEHAVYEAYAKSVRRTIIDSKFTADRT
jgi:hypothetical protein